MSKKSKRSSETVLQENLHTEEHKNMITQRKAKHLLLVKINNIVVNIGI